MINPDRIFSQIFDTGGQVHNPIADGVKADGVTDVTSGLQRFLNEAGAGANIFFPRGFSRITGPLYKLPRQKWAGVGLDSTIVSEGSGPAVIIRDDQFATLGFLRIQGTGGAFGAGASGTHAIEAINVGSMRFDNLFLHNHGGHGLFFHGGAFILNVHRCDVRNNAGDGIHAVSPSGLEQNGNALSVEATTLTASGISGINWLASTLSIGAGSVIEGNLGAGLRIDDTASAPFTANAVSIAGNHFEFNKGPQIYYTLNNFSFGHDIRGNFFNAGVAGGATAIIKMDGVAGKFFGHIGPNTYLFVAPVVNSMDLGGIPGIGSSIDDSIFAPTNVNLGDAFYSPPIRTVLATGVGHTPDDIIAALQAKGIFSQV